MRRCEIDAPEMFLIFNAQLSQPIVIGLKGLIGGYRHAAKLNPMTSTILRLGTVRTPSG